MATTDHSEFAGTAGSACAIKVSPIEGKTFGAFVTGVDCSNLTAEDRQAIKAAFNEHSLLIFPGQFLFDAQKRVEFANTFGDKFEYEEAHFGNEVPTVKSLVRFDLEKLKQKVLEDGKGSGLEFFGKIQLAVQEWHADSTYTPVKSLAGILSAKAVPASGGGTGFADMRAAYDELDDSMKDRLGKLCAYHSNLYSDAKNIKTFARPTEDSYTWHPRAYLRPLVSVHPESGRRSLEIGRHAFGVQGLSPEESEKLLKDLQDFACQGARVYEHSYEVGDLLIWDNRCLMHKGLPYDYSETRTLAGTRLSGNPATEGALPDPDQGRAVLAEEMKRVRLACGLTATPAVRSAL